MEIAYWNITTTFDEVDNILFQYEQKLIHYKGEDL